MFKTIRARLIFSHFLVIVVAMGAAGVFLLSFLEGYFLELTEANLAAQAVITIQTLQPDAAVPSTPTEELPVITNQMTNALPQQNFYVQTDNLAPAESGLVALSDTTVQLGAQLNTRIRWIDPSGEVLLDSAQADGEWMPADWLFAQSAPVESYAVRVERGVMDIAMPVWVDGVWAGTAMLSQPLTELQAVIVTLQGGWLLVLGVVGAMAGGLGLVLAQIITRPLRQLTAAVGAVADGDFSSQVVAHSDDELGRLGRTFNEMTRRLQAARHVQTQFVADVSHELRTPLTALKGVIETLRDGAVDDLEVRDDFLETLEAETNRLIRLVNDLLTLTRADSEALSLKRQSFDLVALVESCVRPLRAGGRDITVRAEVHPLMVEADADRVRQVVMNLSDNALKYSTGCVDIVLGRLSDGAAEVQIHDRGIGIPAAELPHIGRRFYRADRARSRAQGGSGLGVAIAQALVEAHGGALWIESREGVGTSAYFRLR